MISHFFIDRPIFASVLSIVILIVGGVALLQLPIAQYPDVAPPTIQVTATYPGANAKVVADTVATPIEQEVNGVERMLYMASKCTNAGAMNLNVQVAAGRIGQPPVPQDQSITFDMPINTLGRLPDEQQFENIIVKTGKNGQIVHLKDVVRAKTLDANGRPTRKGIELGAKNYDV